MGANSSDPYYEWCLAAKSTAELETEKKHVEALCAGFEKYPDKDHKWLHDEWKLKLEIVTRVLNERKEMVNKDNKKESLLWNHN